MLKLESNSFFLSDLSCLSSGILTSERSGNIVVLKLESNSFFIFLFFPVSQVVFLLFLISFGSFQMWYFRINKVYNSGNIIVILMYKLLKMRC